MFRTNFSHEYKQKLKTLANQFQKYKTVLILKTNHIIYPPNKIKSKYHTIISIDKIIKSIKIDTNSILTHLYIHRHKEHFYKLSRRQLP